VAETVEHALAETGRMGVSGRGGHSGGGPVNITLSVNSDERSDDVEPRRLLVHYLRDDLGLTGTNVGCDTSSCGACTVLLDGESVKACTMLAVQADGHAVTTIEGLAATAPDGGDGGGEAAAVALHPVQRAFHEQHGLQCGFCTPGMVMAAVSLLEENPHPSEADVRLGLEGNLCRCTGYHNIVKSVLAAAGGLDAAASASEEVPA
jgi:carbon-monoxide dehydrogenase small subunit